MAHRTGQNRQQFGLFATVSTHRIRHGRHVERSLDEAATEANRLRVLNSRGSVTLFCNSAA